ncbi:hypothetical protein M406DRAFT_288095 [Cryphonectria parasitica EP155]|uniref:TRIP4/RQT4 C2HC5-type zinc finger domain-containing protein n=1 Tax=Cryphonectria parasitica (strain ATCC 38755 / EP155) TaxID=660469 RepID=A0A9P5CQ37_CRYP1|nr:uncharacterized protein M406DRAFT_288095 [Cryphonectria parasitica EP155]KAF3767119.1 hypothetical protein M406DRAFT_288095 [Cryphonectria parasitica EP155]
MSMNQLSMLLGLPDSELKQIIDYANTLSKAEAADHFKNFLGDSPQAIEFISAFNSRRQDPKPPAPPPATAAAAAAAATSSQPSSDVDAVPKRTKGPKKRKPQIHTPAPRQVVQTGVGPGTVYKKALEDDYMPARSGASTPSLSNSNAASSKAPTPTPKSSTPPPQKKQGKPPPSAAGSLVSDLLAPNKHKPKSNPPSRTSTPGPSSSGGNNNKNNAPPAAKVSITGGLPMHGASGAIADLDSAIRALEITTNPSLSSNKANDVAARRCNCVATRHPLQTAAPNCLNCGKVICLKEGLGPCTSCGHPLLNPDEVQAMIRELKVERGREKQAADREAHRRPDVAAAPRPFTKARTGYEADEAVSSAEAKAREHRDRLLGFQAQNARRTTVRDEAADFDVSGAMMGGTGGGGSIWASPEERAKELKRQQKILREMEWNARPDYEKRQQVVSIDLVGGKVVKKMMAIERPPTPEEDEDHGLDVGPGVLRETSANGRGSSVGGGAFSRNPLLGGMIKPVYDMKGKGTALEGRKDRATRWRRVQDDLNDNEAVILDGGIYGGKDVANTSSSGDEPARG